MFEGFVTRRVRIDDNEINVLVGGQGEPVLLLHGYPQTHVCWHKVAPELARHYTVVCPDLLGYGDSSKPVGDDEHRRYSKREQAALQIQLMERLGWHTFAVVGHDRGARVAYRMALEYPQRVRKLVVLDVVPTLETWEGMDWHASMNNYHWYFLAQPHDFPERMIGAAAEMFIRHMLASWSKTPGAFNEQAMNEYVRCFCQPETIHATCEDYRAGATVDVAYDERDRAAGRRISCPMLVLWGARGRLEQDALSTWRKWATQVQGQSVDCGHFLPEEAPTIVQQEIMKFL